MPLSTTYTPTRPQRAPAKVATARPLRKNSYSNGRMSSATGDAPPGQRGDAAGLAQVVEDDRHAGMLEDLHLGAIGALEDIGGQHLAGRSLADDLSVQADQMREVRSHAIEIMGGQHD